MKELAYDDGERGGLFVRDARVSSEGRASQDELGQHIALIHPSRTAMGIRLDRHRQPQYLVPASGAHPNRVGLRGNPVRSTTINSGAAPQR
jgi:hypothetical protein